MVLLSHERWEESRRHAATVERLGQWDSGNEKLRMQNAKCGQKLIFFDVGERGEWDSKRIEMSCYVLADCFIIVH